LVELIPIEHRNIYIGLGGKKFFYYELYAETFYMSSTHDIENLVKILSDVIINM
jgi:hypothetical protein